MTRPALTVLSLGPGDPGHVTLQTAELLQSGLPLYLRTARHGILPWLEEHGIAYTAFDKFYDESEDFESVYDRITDVLLTQAVRSPILYAVSDPLCDQSVTRLKSAARGAGVDIRVLPGIGLSDVCLSEAVEDLSGSHVVITSAAGLSSLDYDPSEPLLITEVDSGILAGEVKLHLCACLEDDTEVLFFTYSVNGMSSVRKIRLFELDRQKHYDHLTALFVPGCEYTDRHRFRFHDLEKIMTRLRAPDGCPWDKVQTHASLRPYLVEEAWEAVDAMDRNDTEHLADELGDVLLQIVFHAQIAEAYDEFTMTDVVTHICEKMVHRHPFLFDKEREGTPPPSWERIKQEETGSSTIGESLEDVSSSLPSLKYAIKVNKKLSQIPATRQPADQIRDSIRSLAGELLTGRGKLDEEKMGLLLISCMELCRQNESDGEIILHGAVSRMKARYRAAEEKILRDGLDPERLTREQLSDYLGL